MYKVILYYAGGGMFLTKNRRPNGEQMLFESLQEAERAGAQTGLMYEAIRI